MSGIKTMGTVPPAVYIYQERMVGTRCRLLQSVKSHASIHQGGLSTETINGLYTWCSHI